MAEKDYLLMRRYTCPVCGEEFRSPSLKSGKARMIGSDIDLRPKYDGIDTIKYDAILCIHCGYASLERYFKTMTNAQRQLIQEKIWDTFEPCEEKEEFSYEDAILNYKMALLCDVAKVSYDSERAYTCLKTAWLLRGWRESYGVNIDPAREKKLQAQEDAFIRKALEGFVQANMKEDFPICGMDESTLDYLTAALYVHTGQYDQATKVLSGVIASRVAGARVKGRARDLKDDIARKLKEQKA